jgi:hypothetical protein
MVRRLAKLNILSFQASPKIMSLIRFVQRASILAGITFAGIAFHGGSATAQTEKFCVVASNGKTACGTIQAIERACVTTEGSKVVCGKFKAVEQGQEASQPEQTTGYRKESDGINYLLRNCKRSNSDVKCNLVLTTKKENTAFFLQTGKGNSSIVDSTGKTYPSSTLEYNGSNRVGIREKMSVGVDYVFDINFENIPAQVTKAALVNIKTENMIQFRNVPFLN